MHVHLPSANVRADRGATIEEGTMAGEIRNGCSADAIDGAVWRKSTLSGNLGNCVEVAMLGGGGIAVRNSRHPAGPDRLSRTADRLIHTADRLIHTAGEPKSGRRGIRVRRVPWR
jgi:hypothetical protein